MLWRAHSDAVNLNLLEDWLSAKKVERMLKTDLFDELINAGLVPSLHHYARDVIGMDISPTATHKTQAKGSINITADTRRLPFSESTFDVILSNSTLDHYDTTEEIIVSLGEFKRVLKPGGQLLLTLDNPINPLIALRNSLPGTFVSPYYVGKTMGPRQITGILTQMKFRIDDLRAIMHFPRVFVVAVSNMMQKRASKHAQEKLLGGLLAFEKIANWPTRFLTGHFIAVKAIKCSE